jgi:streptogramin lyase
MTMTRSKLGIALAAAALTACSGNQSMPAVAPASSVAGATNAVTTASTGSAVADFVVVVPGASASSVVRGRRPLYISPSTQSVAVDLGKTRVLTLDVAASSSACVSAKGGRRCSGRAHVPAGSQTFAVTAYDGTNANGNVLASGNVNEKLKSGQTEQIGVSLTGKPVSATVSLVAPYPLAGKPTTTAVTVSLLDADGNTILGSYATKVQVADSDTSGATKLSAQSVTTSSTPVTLTYDGSPLSTATISVKAPGFAAATTTFAPSPTTVAEYAAPQIETSNGKLQVGFGDVCLGPDGNIWATGTSLGAIVKVASNGTFTTYPLLGTGPVGISVGPDKHLWFAESTVGKVGTITLAGKITSYSIPTPSGAHSQPAWTTAGSDGREWFVDQGLGLLGAITTSGKMTTYALPKNSFPEGLVTGPDKNLWITDAGLNAVLVFSTDGKLIATHKVPTAKATPWGITVGPDKNIWFAEYGGNRIARMTVSGSVKEFSVPTAMGGPTHVTSGPDGNVWFTEMGATFWDTAGKVGYVSTDGSVIRDFSTILPFSHVSNLAFDAKGNLWYTKFDEVFYSAIDKLVY